MAPGPGGPDQEAKMDRDDIRDPDAPPSAEEAAEAEALRDALGKGTPHAAADFARAVSLAHAPRPIADGEHRALVERAILRGETRRAQGRRRRGRVGIAFATGLALAAAVALTVGSLSRRDEAPSAAASPTLEPLVPVRSTQPLFREPFARTGGESARIDRIASARAIDLRDNRFAAWGVK
jgi:hypothetical protein